MRNRIFADIPHCVNLADAGPGRAEIHLRVSRTTGPDLVHGAQDLQGHSSHLLLRRAASGNKVEHVVENIASFGIHGFGFCATHKKRHVKTVKKGWGGAGEFLMHAKLGISHICKVGNSQFLPACARGSAL